MTNPRRRSEFWTGLSRYLVVFIRRTSTDGLLRPSAWLSDGIVHAIEKTTRICSRLNPVLAGAGASVRVKNGMRSVRPAWVCCVLAACGPSDEPLNEWQSEKAGVVVMVTARPFEVVVRRQSDEVLRLADGEGAYAALAAAVDEPTFVSQLVPGWDGYRANEGPYIAASDAVLERPSPDAVTIRFQSGLAASLTIRHTTERIRFEIAAEELVAHDPTGRHTKASVAFKLQSDEQFFGMGERTATVNHRGWSLYNWCEEGGVGQGEGEAPGPTNPFPNGVSMTNFPVPLVHSSAGYALHLDTTYRSEFHLGSESRDGWRIAVNKNAFAFTVYPHASPLQNLDLYTQDTGRPLIPAPWVFGPRRRLSRGDSVDGEPEWVTLRRRGVPTTSLDDNVHFLPASSHLGEEEQLRTWVDTLHANGFKVMAYNNPYISTTSDRTTEEISYGLEQGLLIRDVDGTLAEAFLISGTPQAVATIDLTLDAGQVWFQSLLKRTVDLGYDGWMHDFGEYIGRSWFAGDGRRGDELHNAYPVLSAKAAHDLLQRERRDDFHFHVRSGYTGSQQYVPAVWNGDPEATFDPTQGLPASLFAGVNLSMSGIAYWGSDISGFKCYTDDPYDKEMYLRWAQLGAVSPIMQSQNACANVTGRRQKWTLWSDAETTAVYGEMARLHTRLQPYFSDLAREAHETGAPLMRHPFLLYPQEPEAWQVQEAFFLGDALYAAPVVRRGDRQKTVWLPPGEYLDWNEGVAYAGDQRVTVPAPLVRLPLFLVANRIVPLLDGAIETLAEATEADVVTPSKVADRLDAVAFMAEGAASRTLEDGTVLAIELVSPAEDDVLESVDADAIADCVLCIVRSRTGTTSAGVERIQINTTVAESAEVRWGPLRLSHQATRPVRIRWDVYVRMP